MSTLVVGAVRTTKIASPTGGLSVTSDVDLGGNDLANVASVNGVDFNNFVSLTAPASAADQVLASSGPGAQARGTAVTVSGSGDVAGVRNLTISRDVSVGGNMTVRGNITYVDSQNVMVEDRYVELGVGNATSTPQPGGVILVRSNASQTFTLTLPSGATFTPGALPSSPPTVSCTFTGTIAAGTILQVTGTGSNDGLYEAQSATANLLTIRGVGGSATVSAYCATNFTAEVLTSPVVPTQVNLAIIEVDSSGRIGVVTASRADSAATKKLLSYVVPNAPSGSFLLSSVGGSLSDIATSTVTIDGGGNVSTNGSLTGGNVTSSGSVSGFSVTGTNVTSNATSANSIAHQASATTLLDLSSSGVTTRAGKSVALSGATSGAVTLLAADATTSYPLKLPPVQGGYQEVMRNDGSGNLSWVPAVGLDVSTGDENGVLPGFMHVYYQRVGAVVAVSWPQFGPVSTTAGGVISAIFSLGFLFGNGSAFTQSSYFTYPVQANGTDQVGTGRFYYDGVNGVARIQFMPLGPASTWASGVSCLIYPGSHTICKT